MRRHGSPRRGYGGRGRSTCGGGGGRRREQFNVSLLVRNIPMDCSTEELGDLFEKFGNLRDVYIPRNYYTRQPRGFAFVEFVDPDGAFEARYHMNGKRISGREITVTFAAESRKNPEQMLQKSSRRESGYDGRRSYHGRSRPRSLSRSCSPHHPSGSRSRYRPRSYSPAPRGRGDYSVSPSRRHADYPRQLRGAPCERDGERTQQPNSSSCDNDDGRDREGNGYHDKSAFEGEGALANQKSSPGRTSRSSSECRSRSADASPKHGCSRSCSLSRSCSPHHPSGSRSRYRSRSYSPAPRGRGDYSVSPSRRHADYPRSPRGAPRERDGERTRQLNSSSCDDDDGCDREGNGYHDKSAFEGECARANQRSSPDRTSRSPSESRSCSADASPKHG